MEEHAWSVKNTKEDKCDKEQEKLVLKKKWKPDHAGPVYHYQENGGQLLQSLGYRSDPTQSGLAAMFRTDDRREASAESERPKVQYCIYLGNRQGSPGEEVVVEKKEPDYLYILKVQLTVLTDGPNVYEKREKPLGGGSVTPSFLSNWKKLTLNEIRKCAGRSGLGELNVKESNLGYIKFKMSIISTSEDVQQQLNRILNSVERTFEPY